MYHVDTGVEFFEWPICSGRSGNIAPTFVFTQLDVNAPFDRSNVDTASYCGLRLCVQYLPHVASQLKLDRSLRSDVGVMHQRDESEWAEHLLSQCAHTHGRIVTRVVIRRLQATLDKAFDRWKVTGVGEVVVAVSLGDPVRLRSDGAGRTTSMRCPARH